MKRSNLRASERCRDAGLKPEWMDVQFDLNRLQEVTIERGGKTYRVRTEATGCVSGLFNTVRLALPPRLCEVGTTPVKKTRSKQKKRTSHPKS